MFSSLAKFQGQVKNKKEGKRWWLYHATDFQSLMYPCFTICRILGAFPYTINGLSFVISKPFYILSNIVMCVFFFSVFIIIYMMNFYKWYSEHKHNDIGMNLVYITSSFIVIITLVLNKPRMRLLQAIMKISSRLPPKLYQMLSVLIHTKDIFGFSYLLVHALYGHYKMQISPLVSPLWLYIILLVFQMDMLYINCVCVLKICFKRINEDLANLFINNESHLINWFNHKQRNPLLMKLKALKKQHLMVSDKVQKLNIIFSPHLLATIGLSFISITFQLYQNVQWENGLSINWTMKIGRTYVILDTVYHFLKIALIAWACESGKNQAIKISTTIHDVLNMLNSTNDKEVRLELQLFSLQTMHCYNIFSAKGLTLDATLIKTVMGTVTTYLLILIQFFAMSHSCDEKIAINVTQES